VHVKELIQNNHFEG